VAERYAHVPSYNEMLTREARAAVQAAEAASKAAQQAHAAFQYVLEGLEAANSAEPDWKPEPVSERHGAPVAVAPPQKLSQRPQVHHEAAAAPSWELETDAQPDDAGSYEALPRSNRPSIYERPSIMEAQLGEPGQRTQPDEIAQPIYANLIEFPREMIATRRVRPRRAEGPLAEAASAPQLSIFEVEPSAISIQPAPATMEPPVTPEWMRPEWPAMTLEALPPSSNFEALPPSRKFAASNSAMTLEAELPSTNFAAELPSTSFAAQRPSTNFAPQHSATNFAAQPRTLELEAQPRQQIVDELLEEPAPIPARDIEPAPMSRRLLATFVDCTLIAAALVAAAALAAFNVNELPGIRALEFSAALALLAIGVAYHACFMTLARATPGMKYAGIEINTFAGYTAGRGRRCGRLLAMVLSLLPLGLGVVWALFDDGHLTWHDRLSKTYLRKR
jgi:uncharacterized RDD family membrane protein YckC